MSKTRLACVLVCLVVTGCDNANRVRSTAEPSNAGATATASAVDEDEQPIELADAGQDYLPIFSQDLPQNVISGRMEKNIRRWRNTVEDFELIPLPSAGLRVYPPPGFHRSKRFTGFEFEREEKKPIDQSESVKEEKLAEDTNRFKLGIIHYISQPYPLKTTRDIIRNEMNLRSQKGRLLFMTSMKIGTMDAELYVGQESPERLQGGTLAKFTLIFGDESFSWVVKATFDADMENELGLVTLQSILNTRLSDEPRLPAGQDVDFTITPGRLSIVDGFIDRMVFALEGDFPSDSRLPIFMVGRSLIDVVEADRRLTARRMANPPGLYRLSRISGFKEIEIDGLTGYETVAVGFDQATNQPLHFYSVSLFDGPRHYLMNAWVGADNSQNFIDDFRDLAFSFRRKQVDDESKENDG